MIRLKQPVVHTSGQRRIQRDGEVFHKLPTTISCNSRNGGHRHKKRKEAACFLKFLSKVIAVLSSADKITLKSILIPPEAPT